MCEIDWSAFMWCIFLLDRSTNVAMFSALVLVIIAPAFCILLY
jgi:hypothetical protein